jgi:hypothetical protein
MYVISCFVTKYYDQKWNKEISLKTLNTNENENFDESNNGSEDTYSDAQENFDNSSKEAINLIINDGSDESESDNNDNNLNINEGSEPLLVVNKNNHKRCAIL